MASRRTNPSYQTKTLTKEQADLIVSCITFCVKRAQEVTSMIQNSNSSMLTLSLCPLNSTAATIFSFIRQNLEVQTLVSQILQSLGISMNIINDIMRFNPTLDQAAFLSPMTNPGVASRFDQPNQATWSLPSTRPTKRAAISPIFPQQAQTALFSALYLPNYPGSNIASTSSAAAVPPNKKSFEALYGPNNELPEKLRYIEPHLIRQIMSDILDQDHSSTVMWHDIAGLEHAKNSVKETVVWPVLNPRIFQGVRSVGKGVLLFGPPGTGKTMIGKAVAGEMKGTFFNLSASTLTCRWLGDGEKLVRALFGLAKHFQPSVIFLDEIDSVLFRRSSAAEHEASRRLKAQFLVEMEGIDSGNEQIVVIGATNRPHDLDGVMLRRLSKRLYVPLPTAQARLQIVRNTMEKVGKVLLSEKELDDICKLTDGYSGSDMRNLVNEAMMGPVRDAINETKNGKGISKLELADLRPLGHQDFQNALKEVRPSVSQHELAFYAEWNARFGSISL